MELRDLMDHLELKANKLVGKEEKYHYCYTYYLLLWTISFSCDYLTVGTYWRSWSTRNGWS